MIPTISRIPADALPATAGIYALVVEISRADSFKVGALGEIEFPPGFYIYIGSARGPGGLRGRVSRHLRSTNKRRHWHIDYVLEHAVLMNVYWSTDEKMTECGLAAELTAFGEVHPQHFGASDCRCPGHLILLDGPAGLTLLRNGMTGVLPGKANSMD